MSVTDLFCGAGGSTTGALTVPGVSVRLAANHWQTAIDTHQVNHPDIDHDCADLSQVDPRRYPTTDLLWASPECTHHSQAQGRRRSRQTTAPLFDHPQSPEPVEVAGVRSRATMWDVVRFAEHHRYRALIVENVVDAANWVLWPAWRHALDALGYCVHTIWLNSMHAAAAGPPAPQSRDRLYILAHQHPTQPRPGRKLLGRPGGMACPDLDAWTRPQAWCPTCHEQVAAVQAWKRPERPRWGRYRAQYTYRCPHTRCRNRPLDPPWLPATTVIDATDPGHRIGDRTRPLAAHTRRRIATGITRHWHPHTTHTTHTDPTSPGHHHPTHQPVAAAAGAALIVEMRGGGSTARPATQPLSTVTASGNHHALITPPPHASPGTHTRSTGRTEPDCGAGGAVAVDDCRFRMLHPHEIQAAMAFPASYALLGTRRDVIRQLGNAVTPPAARDLIAATVHALTGTDPRHHTDARQPETTTRRRTTTGDPTSPLPRPRPTATPPQENP